MVMIFGIALGIIGGCLLGLWISKQVIRLLSANSHETVIFWSGCFGLIAAAFPAFFMAVVVGGTVGGGIGEAVFTYLGINVVALGPSVGVAVGLGSLLAGGLIVGTSLGALIGRGVASLLPKPGT
jgi:hypothetical protein